MPVIPDVFVSQDLFQENMPTYKAVDKSDFGLQIDGPPLTHFPIIHDHGFYSAASGSPDIHMADKAPSSSVKRSITPYTLPDSKRRRPDGRQNGSSVARHISNTCTMDNFEKVTVNGVKCAGPLALASDITTSTYDINEKEVFLSLSMHNTGDAKIGFSSTLDHTAREDEEFHPDAVVRDDRVGATEHFGLVHATQADRSIKGLLEGAFGDDEDKQRITTRGRQRREKSGDNGEEKQEQEPEEEDDDGTVDGLAVKLLPHQVDGVSWMVDKEVGQRKKNGILPQGGILADDMGLGKTIQSLALILNNPRPEHEEHSENKTKDKEKEITSTVCKSTLVVAPLGLIKQWESEVKTKVLPSHKLSVLVHHGPSRTKRADDLERYDIVITTYQVLTSEYSASFDKLDSPKIGCYTVHWYRIILDEGHSIKNRNAKMTKAAYNLRSHYRWCLTGTPMQNNIDELQSLIKFLRIKPYDELSRWKNDIAGPMKSGRGTLAMRRLQVFLKAFMKRRTKNVLKQEDALNPGGKPSKDGQKNEGFKIVGRKVETVVADFTPHERRFYDRLADRAQNRLRELMGGDKADYMGALVLLLRLRQACNHPDLVGGQVDKDKDAINGAGSGEPKVVQSPRNSEIEENIGLGGLGDFFGGISVASKHCDVCQMNLFMAEASARAVRCVDCDAGLAEYNKLVRSTKIARLLEILDKEARDHKVIVFSQFTSMLDLIEPFLHDRGHRFTRYDGSMRNNVREASLSKLRNDPTTRILLCSLKCGSLGLNLTAASRVVILEPFWNPFVEEQAIDRVHRLNQTVDVVVYKLTIRNTVEERILNLQEAKRKLANAAIDGGKAINKLSIKDIMNLFHRDAENEHPPVDTQNINFGSSFEGVLGRTVDCRGY